MYSDSWRTMRLRGLRSKENSGCRDLGDVVEVAAESPAADSVASSFAL